jgi:hypothetical protein
VCRREGWRLYSQSPTPPPRGQSRRLLPASTRYRAHVDPRLEIAACRRLCSWARTEESLDGEPVFRCDGCGSEWVASEHWTPIDHTGVVPEAVQAERRRGRG